MGTLAREDLSLPPLPRSPQSPHCPEVGSPRSKGPQVTLWEQGWSPPALYLCPIPKGLSRGPSDQTSKTQSPPVLMAARLRPPRGGAGHHTPATTLRTARFRDANTEAGKRPPSPSVWFWDKAVRGPDRKERAGRRRHRGQGPQPCLHAQVGSGSCLRLAPSHSKEPL